MFCRMAVLKTFITTAFREQVSGNLIKCFVHWHQTSAFKIEFKCLQFFSKCYFTFKGCSEYARETAFKKYFFQKKTKYNSQIQKIKAGGSLKLDQFLST